MASLRRRHRQPEIMDQPGLSADQHHRALRGLARINFFSRSAGLLWPALAQLARDLSPAPLRLLDVASGGADVAIRLAKKAARSGIDLRITCRDVSEQAVAFARARAAEAGVSVSFEVADALAG